MRTFNVGVIGLVHDHCWSEMEKAHRTPGVRLVAVADRNRPLLKRALKLYPALRAFTDWRRMIRQEKIDIAQLTLENGATHPVVAELARHGIHMYSEKPMSARLNQAEIMLKAAAKHKVKLLINWPTAWNPALHEARRLVSRGAIGQVYYVKARGGHKGPKEIGCSPYFYRWLYNARLNGAGSLADYAGYGANMMRYVLGCQPISVSGIARRLTKRYYVPDDNAILTLEYRNAVGVIETTWSQVATPSYPNPLFYGTAGTLGVVGRELHLWRPGKKAKVIKPKLMPKGQRCAAEYLAWAIRNRRPIEGPCSPKLSRDAQEVIEAGILSSASGRRLRLPL